MSFIQRRFAAAAARKSKMFSGMGSQARAEMAKEAAIELIPEGATQDEVNTAGNARFRFAAYPDGSRLLCFDAMFRMFSEIPSSKRMRSVSSVLRVPVTPPGQLKSSPVVAPFDSAGIAAKIAQSQGKTVEDVLDEWDKIRRFGVGFHAFAFQHIANRTPVESADDCLWEDDEHLEYREALKQYISNLQGHGYTIPSGGSEQMVWNPDVRVAGLIDCVFKCEEGNDVVCEEPHYLLVDWKTNSKNLRGSIRFAEESLGWPYTKLPGSRIHEYFVQLNVLKFLFVRGGWAGGLPVKMGLVQFERTAAGTVSLDCVEVPDLEEETRNFVHALSTAS